jgi:putative membrane protein
MLDLVLAILHHLLVFGLAAILAAELALVGPRLGPDQLRKLARLDIHYGAIAGLIVVVGFSRAVFAAKGWAYYSGNHYFWAKIGAFAVLGLLSILPTVRFIQWRGAERAEPGRLPPASELAGVRRVLWLEAAVFAFIPVFAAAMARGYGAR